MSRVDWHHRLRCGEGLRPGWAGIMQLSNAFVAQGLSDTAIRSRLLDVNNEGARFINISSIGQVRPTSKRERMVTSAISKAREHQDSSRPIGDKAEAIETLARIRDHVDDDPTRWKGTGGATDRAVLYAALDIAMKRGSLEFNASVRQLADGANVGVRGAHSAKRRLNDWFEVVSLGAGTRASTLRFRREAPTATLNVPEGTEPEGCGEYLRHDLWRHDGLGKSTARVYDVFFAKSVWTAAEIADQLGLTRRTITKHLTKLRRVGLLEEPDRSDDTAYWMTPDQASYEALSAIASELGLDGKGEAQRQQHHARSENRAAFLRHQRQRKQDRRGAAGGTNGNATEPSPLELEVGPLVRPPMAEQTEVAT